jgi:hypothetical protein
MRPPIPPVLGAADKYQKQLSADQGDRRHRLRVAAGTKPTPHLAIAAMKALIALAEQGRLLPRRPAEPGHGALQLVIDRAVTGKAVLLS